MLLVRSIRTLLSLPFLWVGGGLAMLKVAPALSFLTAAWLIGGKGEVARQALAFLLTTRGQAAALARAEAWMRRRPRVEIAAFAGLLAVDDDPDAARAYLERCGELGEDRKGMVEILEFFVAIHQGDPAKTNEVVARLGRRNDLPPILTKQILTRQLWERLASREFPEARRRATHLLDVDENPSAHMALWALERHEGREVSAETHLRLAAKMPQAQRLHSQCLGSLAIGKPNEAGTYLAELREIDPDLAATVAPMPYAEEPR